MTTARIGENVVLARLATFHDARRHFEAGGRVLVSERGHEPYHVVTSSTTTHSSQSTTWAELAATVREWRSRYPNQRFYIVEETADHLAAKAELHEVSLAAHLVYDHNQPRRLPATRKGLVDLHSRLHGPNSKDAAP